MVMRFTAKTEQNNRLVGFVLSSPVQPSDVIVTYIWRGPTFAGLLVQDNQSYQLEIFDPAMGKIPELFTGQSLHHMGGHI